MKFGLKKTRNIAVSRDVDMLTDNSFVLSQSTRLTDRRA